VFRLFDTQLGLPDLAYRPRRIYTTFAHQLWVHFRTIDEDTVELLNLAQKFRLGRLTRSGITSQSIYTSSGRTNLHKLIYLYETRTHELLYVHMYAWSCTAAPGPIYYKYHLYFAVVSSEQSPLHSLIELPPFTPTQISFTFPISLSLNRTLNLSPSAVYLHSPQSSCRL
jgi:hypothetical protein